MRTIHRQRTHQKVLIWGGIMKARRLNTKYGNFIKDKLYEVYSMAEYINGKMTGLYIVDEDGFRYHLDGGKRYKIAWEIIDEEYPGTLYDYFKLNKSKWRD